MEEKSKVVKALESGESQSIDIELVEDITKIKDIIEEETEI